jgi:hypothetical protein
MPQIAILPLNYIHLQISKLYSFLELMYNNEEFEIITNIQ